MTNNTPTITAYTIREKGHTAYTTITVAKSQEFALRKALRALATAKRVNGGNYKLVEEYSDGSVAEYTED